MNRPLLVIISFLFLSNGLFANATAVAPTFTNKHELNLQIRQNEHNSAAVYETIMRANSLNLLDTAINTYAHLAKKHPKNWLLVAGRGFGEFVASGWMSKWLSAPRSKWPHYVTALYERGRFLPRQRYQIDVFSYSGSHSVREAAVHLPKDPYVMIMDCFANFYGVCTYEGYTGKELQQFRDLTARYIAKMKYVTAKYPEIGDAWGLYAETFNTMATTFGFQNVPQYLRYVRFANRCFQKMKDPTPYWYDNRFSLDFGITLDVLGQPREAPTDYNYYFKHCVQPTSRQQIYTFNIIKDHTYKLVHKEIATHKNLNFR